MENRELVAATLTAALLKPMDHTRPDPNAEGHAAIHAVELYTKVLGALAAKEPPLSSAD
jgi:hypothetical protein